MRLHLIALATSFGLSLPALADEATFADVADLPSVSVSVDDSQEAATWRTLVDDVFIVPYGITYSPLYNFGRGLRTDVLRTRLFQFVGETCGSSIEAVDLATSPEQRILSRHVPNLNGEIDVAGGTVYKAVVVFNQRLLRGGRCILRIEDLIGDRDPDTTPGFELAGVIHYSGGFRNQEPVALTSPDKIVAFWARVPAFCGGLEILEGGVISEGVYDAADMTDATRHIFEVNGGAGARASAVVLTFNGPSSLECDVPVYVKKIAP